MLIEKVNLKIDFYHIFLYVIIFILALFIGFWYSNYYKNIKFQVFLRFLSAIAIIFAILAIVIQGLNFEESLKERNTNFFSNLTKSFIHDILELFMKYPEMNYYYNDLMGYKRINLNTNRNLTQENQISMLIYAKLASIAYFVEIYGENDLTNGIISRTNNIMKTFLESPTFKSYWEEYDKKLAGNPVRKYLKKYFNIDSKNLK